jgi:hypothetical protein
LFGEAEAGAGAAGGDAPAVFDGAAGLGFELPGVAAGAGQLPAVLELLLAASE